MTEKLGDKCQLVGDDLFVTNPDRLRDELLIEAENARRLPSDPDWDTIDNPGIRWGGPIKEHENVFLIVSFPSTRLQSEKYFLILAVEKERP
mgnify:CR=1 FL=1